MKEIIKAIPFVNAYALFVTGLIFTLLLILVFADMPQDKLLQIGDIKTALLTILASIVSYFFGSSRSSKARDEVMNNAITEGMKNNTNTTNTNA